MTPYDRAVLSLARFEDDLVERWEDAMADRPADVMAQVGRAYVQALSSERDGAHAAALMLDSIEGSASATPQEHGHLAAARAFARGDLHGARVGLARVVAEHPTDLLALLVGHQLDLFCGDALTLRNRIAGSVSGWPEEDPRFGFVLGMLAFGLEECGHHAEAEEVGHRALDRDPRDVWALHAVVHTHEMRGQIDDGLALLAARRRDWTEGNFLVVHNSWHEGLFRFDRGDSDDAIRIYDSVLHHADSEGVAMEMLDAASLLWRFHLEGVDVGGRWVPLADAWTAALREPWYVFNDVHATMALVGAGRLEEARALTDRLVRWVEATPSTESANVAMTAEVGLPVCSALVAFGEERFEDVVDILFSVRPMLPRFGGSHAQRDVVTRTLGAAARRCGDIGVVRSLASERLTLAPGQPAALRQVGVLSG